MKFINKIKEKFNKINKKSLVITFFCIGILLISISTFYFLYKIPQLDKHILDTNQNIEDRLDAHSLFQITESNGMDIHNQIKILSEINPNSSYIKDLNEEMLIQKRESLVSAYQISTGALPNNELTKKWGKMNFDELEYEKVRYFSNIDSFHDLMVNLNEIRNKKQNIQFWATIFQVLGLLINQIAIILNIKWFSREKVTETI
ncbi:MAG: hypothetical protein Q7R52_00680 [archaeon]|nr:hypothetical protein [archaeon]